MDRAPTDPQKRRTVVAWKFFLLLIIVSALIGWLLFDLVLHRDINRSIKDLTLIATNQYFSKGGLGIINTNLYIVVQSATNGSNGLIVCPTPSVEERWKGRSITNAEVVVYYGGKVYSADSLPDRFDLSKAIIVSFERDKVRFLNFQAMDGGYYERIKE